MKNLLEIIDVFGGIVGLFGGLIGIWSAKKTLENNKKTQENSEKSLDTSERAIELTKESLTLRHDSFVYWNSEKRIAVCAKPKDDEPADFFDDSKWFFEGYGAELTINPFVSAGVVKGIFICGACLKEMISIASNTFTTVEIEINKNLRPIELFIIFYSDDNTFSFEVFLLFPEIINTEKYWKYKSDNKTKRLNYPKYLEVLKFKQNELIAKGSLRKKIDKLYHKHPELKYEKNEEIDTIELENRAWNYIEEIKARYRI